MLEMNQHINSTTKYEPLLLGTKEEYKPSVRIIKSANVAAAKNGSKNLIQFSVIPPSL